MNCENQELAAEELEESIDELQNKYELELERIVNECKAKFAAQVSSLKMKLFLQSIIENTEN